MLISLFGKNLRFSFAYLGKTAKKVEIGVFAEKHLVENNKSGKIA